MAQCPSCQSTNVVVTEEIFTRKGRLYYRFWQTIWVFFFIGGGFVIEQIAYGFLAAFLSAIIVAIFSLVNASRRATSKTKLTCVTCKRVTYLN
jgi:hypothetical protein